MGVLAGNQMVVKVSNTAFTSPSDGYVISNMDKSTLKETAEILEITGFGDEYKKRKAGIKDTDLSLSGTLDTEDTGQLMLEAGATVFIAMFPEGLTKSGKQIEMIVESVEQNAEAAGKQEISVQLLGNGAPTVVPAT